jgi:hypothetical protein
MVAALLWLMPDSSHPRMTDWRCSISALVAMVWRLTALIQYQIFRTFRTISKMLARFRFGG